MGFLVVGRKIGEGLKLKVEDVEIELFISDINGKRCDLAINAPMVVTIERQKRHIDQMKGKRHANHHRKRRAEET